MKLFLLILQLVILIGSFFLVDMIALSAMGYTEDRLPRGLRWYFNLYPYLKGSIISSAAFPVYFFWKKSLKGLWFSTALAISILLLLVALRLFPQPDSYDYLEGMLPNSPNHSHWGSCKRGEEHGVCKYMLITQMKGAQITFDFFEPREIQECDKINVSEYAQDDSSFQKLLDSFPTVLETEATQCYRSNKFPSTQVLRVASFIFLYDEPTGFYNESF